MRVCMCVEREREGGKRYLLGYVSDHHLAPLTLGLRYPNLDLCDF